MEHIRKTRVTKQAHWSLVQLYRAAREAEALVDQGMAEDLHEVCRLLNEILKASERRKYVRQTTIAF